MRKELVSIIIPVYNAERFIEDTIDSIKAQTYSQWELLLIDDCSKDSSKEIIEKYAKEDSRIKYTKLEKNSGAAMARNKGIELAQGRYICFLDADDKWVKTKLKSQIDFMRKKKCAFSFTSYQFADDKCNPNGAKVIVPKTINYKQALKNTTIWTSTVMFDMKKLTKELVYMPNVKSEDTACWWKILKTGVVAYGMQDIMSYYRRTEGTLSSNKIEAIKRIWNLYRNVEHLNIFSSAYNFCWYAFNAVRRRV